MATATRIHPQSGVTQRQLAGWPLIVLGLAVVAWWISAWSKVDGLIDAHEASQGTLPSSAMERAGLSANGTPAEQALSTSLSDVPGLYPWGRLPLVLGALAVLAGWLVSGPTTISRVAAAITTSALLLAVPLSVFGDSLRIALDILE